MKQDKLHLINKLFNNETIRTVWDKEDENIILAQQIQLEYYLKVKINNLIGEN